MPRTSSIDSLRPRCRVSRRTINPTLALALPLITLGACGAADRAAIPVAEVRDSAGIEIVTNAGPGRWMAEEAWEVEEAVSIGELEGPVEYTFNRIVDIVVASSGRVYVLDGGDNVIKTYSTAGEHLFTFGGPGEGPAEFERAANLGLRGDSVVVYDYSLSKLAHFSADGELLKTDRSNLNLWEYGFPTILAPLDEGHAIVLTTGCSLPPPEERRPEWKLLTLDPGARVRDTVAIYTSRELLPIYGEGDSFCSTARAPAPRTHNLAVRSDGYAAYGEGESYEIRVLRLSDGGLDEPVRLIRRDTPPLPFTSTEAGAYRAERLEQYRSGEGSRDQDMIAAIEAAWDTTTFPRTWPAFDDLHWDDEDNLWARRGGPDSSESREWDIFDPEGALLGTVALPAGLTVHAITGGQVWGTIQDEFDLQYVKGYKIVR